MTTLRRITIALFWAGTASVCAAACASTGDLKTVGEDLQPDGAVSMGASSSSGTGGSSSSTGGSSSTNGGSSSTTGGSGGQPGGSCNPTFCPASGMGEPCCASPNGPCGLDFGNGCVASVPTDGGP